MKYSQFIELVRARGWSVPQLRCDVRPTDEILHQIDTLGPDKYECFLERYLTIVRPRRQRKLPSCTPRLTLEQEPPE
jgi:hypothetical protein